jgi:hypothetical protein
MNDNGKTPKFSGFAGNSNGDFGKGENDNRIHSSGPSAEYSDLMPEILTTGKPESNSTEYAAAQHQNFNRPFVGTMDAVNRGGNPETPILDSAFVGVDDFTPPANRSTSTQSRAPRQPTRAKELTVRSLRREGA